jgi:hypothetical protein
MIGLSALAHEDGIPGDVDQCRITAIRRLRGWLGSSTWAAAKFRTAAELKFLARQAGLSVTAVRGGVYYPPFGVAARALLPLDSGLGRLTTFGAAFIGVRAERIDSRSKKGRSQ